MVSRKHIGTLHAHGCKRCHTRYTDACTTPATDALCVACTGGLPWSVLIESAAPHPCCSDSRLVTTDEKSSYRLAGSCLWFICRRCSRTHPFKPRSTSE